MENSTNFFFFEPFPKITYLDKTLLKQTKTTTKPLFNPAPFIVTEVEGNQVTITDGDIVKKRDKNKLKVLPKRKALGHQSDKVVRCEKVRHNQDIEIDMQKICDSIRDHEPVQEPEQQVQEPGLVEVAEHQPHEEELQPLYRPSEDMNNHLQALLMSAAARSAEEPNPSPSSTPPPLLPLWLTRGPPGARVWRWSGIHGWGPETLLCVPTWKMNDRLAVPVCWVLY